MYGVMKFGECGYGTWPIPWSYGNMHLRRKNFDAHEDIGADRT